MGIAQGASERQNKNGDLSLRFFEYRLNAKYQRLQTYMVTSKPKRISVAAGLVHMVISPKQFEFNADELLAIHTTYESHTTRPLKNPIVHSH